ncbi:GM13128 [Drosophila sechellia]|uniref:GM13128 n=1 Tax=Drosophila sechellia TaxID=7238 RepID=B4IML2_DROSE|nr:GM13128 [Drosophila sechellia]
MVNNFQWHTLQECSLKVKLTTLVTSLLLRRFSCNALPSLSWVLLDNGRRVGRDGIRMLWGRAYRPQVSQRSAWDHLCRPRTPPTLLEHAKSFSSPPEDLLTAGTGLGYYGAGCIVGVIDILSSSTIDFKSLSLSDSV